MNRPRYLRILWVLVLLGWASFPCAAGVKDGIRLFTENRYPEAVASLTKVLAAEPDLPEARFYLGRALLASDRAEEALPHLKRAAALWPDSAETLFWLGVGYWAVMDFAEEMACYEKALAIDPDHLPSRLYLGHARLDRGEWGKAIAAYDQVLRRDPGSAEALYNRGLAIRQEGKDRQAEEAAWLAYLRRYQSGTWALRAAGHLNELGNFSFRPVLVGARGIVLPALTFSPGAAHLSPADEAALRSLGTVVSHNPRVMLHIVAYADGRRDLAGRRANAVKQYLLTTFPGIDPDRLHLSWFGDPESVRAGGFPLRLAESLTFFTDAAPGTKTLTKGESE